MKKASLLFFSCILLVLLLVACNANDNCTLVFHTDASVPFTQAWDPETSSEYALPVGPQKKGHTFTGWYLDEACTVRFDPASTVGKSSLDLYAGYLKNSYTVTMIVDSEEESYVFLYGEEITPPKPSSNLLLFDGYYLDSLFEQKLTDTTMPAKDLVLYVKWKDKPAFPFTVTFHTDSSAPTTQTLQSTDLDEYVWPAPEKKGYTFTGWYLDEACTSLFDPASIAEECTLDLYAGYEINQYTLTVFDGAGERTHTYAYGEAILLSEPSLEDFIFDGFYLDSAFETPFSYTEMPDCDLVAYIKWIPTSFDTVTIFIHTDFSAPFMMMVKVDEIDDFVLPIPEKEGHLFRGWYVDAELQTPFNLLDMANKPTLHLYADYKINSYTLTVHDGHKITTQTLLFGETITLTKPTSDHYIFDGFYTDPQCKNVLSNETMPGKDLDVYIKWKDGYTVTIVTNIPGAITFEGKTTQILLVRPDQFETVTASANFGYRFVGYEVGGIRYIDNTIRLRRLTGNTTIKVIADYATHELPIVNITTAGGAEIDSKIDYTDMTFSLLNTNDELEGIAGGIRLRGNSTKAYPKKPYRIKFDSKQSLFGHEKAKSWVLLAEYLDPSALHNYTALSLGAEADGLKFTATPHKVNVYLNGRFEGLYTLCEQVQENEGRMDIEQKITPAMTNLRDFNFFVCMDWSVKDDKNAVEGEDYFILKSGSTSLYFELKYPEKEDFVSEAQFRSFFSQLVAYIQDMLYIANSRDYTRMQQEFNLDSLIDYFIIDQIMGEHDHGNKSFNMYHTVTSTDAREIGKLTFGPIWDYDWSLHTPWTGSPNMYYEVDDTRHYSNAFMQAVRYTPDLYMRAKVRYQEHFYQVLSDFLPTLYQMEADIKESLALNAERWYSHLPSDLTEKNIDFLNRYLVHRLEMYKRHWAI